MSQIPTRGLIVRKVSIIICIILLAALTSVRESAAEFNDGLIDFDYNWTDLGYPAYGPGPGAIGSAGDLWNTSQLYPTGPLPLNKTDGSATSVMWSLSGAGGVAANISGVYAKLFDVSTYIFSATITGLTPNRQYNLYLFEAYWGETIDVNGISFTTPGIRFGSVDSLTAGSQYDVHTVTADSSGKLTFVPISAQYDNPYITSWQLAQVPEPSPISLVGLALAAALLGTRRLLRNVS
jgi:hypothetical protein